MNQVVGQLVRTYSVDSDRIGIVNVRGTKVRIRLALTPDATVGDTLLIDAGVAVAVLEHTTEFHRYERRS